MATLPSFDDMLAASKRRKTSALGFRQAIETLTHVDVTDLKSEDFSESSILSWLYAKYDTAAVDKLRALRGIHTDIQLTELFNLDIKREDALEIFSLLKPRSEHYDVPLVLSPPTNCCYDCGNNLVSNHSSRVKVYSLKGFKIATKFTLRCKPCNIYYNYATFGNKHELGFRYYPIMRNYIEASDCVYFERKVLDLQCSLANHSWVSFQGFAESYNDTFLMTADQELSPHTVGELFYNGEIEDELRRINRLDYRFKFDSDREKCMDMIEKLRGLSNYDHSREECTEACKKRGCGRLWATDGIWKTVFPHCMFKVEQTSMDFPALNLPDVCTSSPQRSKAFCEEHCLLLQNEAPSIPLNLKEFLKFCNASSDKDGAKVDSIIDNLNIKNNTVGESAIQSQGSEKLLNDQPLLVQHAVIDDPSQPLCRKETGTGHKMRKWSRGHQFIVRGGGHIDTWQPLYKSESPSQVFFILIQWLLNTTSTGISPQQIIVAYDNMCNLDRMKISKMTLPFDPPLNRLWLDIIKIIDVFHFKNHTSEECKKKYSPQQIKEANPDFNTQAGEQTFIWVGRFKNILCSMNKTHHLFYLHRMVLRRNTYTAKCYKHGRKPVLPKK